MNRRKFLLGTAALPVAALVVTESSFERWRRETLANPLWFDQPKYRVHERFIGGYVDPKFFDALGPTSGSIPPYLVDPDHWSLADDVPVRWHNVEPPQPRKVKVDFSGWRMTVGSAAGTSTVRGL